jgi:hypothetical protein
MAVTMTEDDLSFPPAVGQPSQGTSIISYGEPVAFNETFAYNVEEAMMV